MKLPKNLQNKKKSAKPHIEKLKKEILKTFRSEFIKKKRKFNDHRSEIFNTESSLNETEDYVNIHYGERDIEIIVNYKKFDEDIFIIPDFRENFVFYKNHIKHIAHHEYGHSFLVPTTFDLKPIEVKNYLKKLGVKDSKSLPSDKKKEFNKIYTNSIFCKTIARLKNVNLLSLYKQFREFHATYMIIVRDIDNSIPSETLKLDFNKLSAIIFNFRNKKEEFIEYYKSSEEYQLFQFNPYFVIVLDALWLTHRFYIYNEWNVLIELFNKTKMTYFLYLLHNISGTFKIISDKHSDIDIITKVIIKLSEVLDKLNYEDLIIENNFDEKHQDELTKFMTELEQDKLILD